MRRALASSSRDPSASRHSGSASRPGNPLKHLTWVIPALLSFGCASIVGTLPRPVPPVAPGAFQVGAARVDITPMPGFPMGGMSAAGKISRGVWTRLHARAVVLEDRSGSDVALVACDLWSIPAGLADRVAELAASRYGATGLARERIVLAATHTHHSPGNYSSSIAYNAAGSLKPGFDPRLFDFLADRIAFSIGEAWRSRQPAVLVRGETRVGRIARSRSLEPFLANGAPAQALLEENADLPIEVTAFPAGGERAYRALDPTLTVIRAEASPPVAGRPPLAVMAFFAMHPTVMGTQAEIYNSDVFGIASSTLELRHDPTVVAMFNGPEGDVTPNWERQDRPAALKIAGVLADSIQALLARPGQDVTGPIHVRWTRASLRDLARPMTGASQLCGGEGDWSFFRSAGCRAGMREEDPRRRVKGQGAKMSPFAPDVLQSSLPFDPSGLITRALGFPGEVSLGVYGIGDVTLGTLPGEFTTLLGRRLAAAIASAAPTSERVLLVGLANEYLSYFTTEAEYDLQHYEGASTLYGPGAPGRIEQLLRSLAADTATTSPARSREATYAYTAGPTASFGVKEFDFLKHTERLIDSYYSLANVLMDARSGIPTPDYPYMVWVDANPRWPSPGDRRRLLTPAVCVERRVGGEWVPLLVEGIAETDEGVDVVTTVVASFLGRTRWVTTWMVPAGLDEDAVLRLVARGTSGKEFRSKPFTLAEARKDWGFVGLASPEEPGT